MLDILSQRFLQGISTKGVMSDEEAAKEATSLFGMNVTQEKIQSINSKLEPLNFTIKAAYCELTGKKYWVFTSNVIDKSMTFPGMFTDVQLEFVRKVFSEIINSEEGHMSTMACINVRADMTGTFSPTNAQEMLTLMIEQKWINETNGEIYMGVRSIGGLLPYFKDSYADDLSVCSLCKDTVFHGYSCGNCQSVTHLYCLAKASKFQKTLKCMGCNARIEVENLPALDGDDSLEVDEEEVSPARPSKSQKSRSSKRRG